MLEPAIAARLLVRALGGAGSGNFGHAGRPGEVGGSAPSDGPTDTAAFKAWFGTSKVVDEQGQPLVVYHRGSFDERDEIAPQVGDEGMHFGTRAAADARPVGKEVDDRIKSIEIEQDAETGKWHWSMDGIESFDLDEEGFDSKAEARENAEQEAQNMAEYAEWDEDDIPLTSAYLKIENPMRTIDHGADWTKVVAKAKALGHDGIIYRNQFEDKGSLSYVIFKGTQIKSTKSKGFDPKNPLITLGGPGSGNFGHAGRPGEVGGSGPGGKSREPDEETRVKLEQAMLSEVPDSAAYPNSDLSQASNGQRGKVKEKIVNDVHKNQIVGDMLSKQAIQDRLDQWAVTSGDSNPHSIAMQEAIKQEFGLVDAVTEHMEVSPYKGTPEHFDWDQINKDDRAYSRAEYNNTQAWLKSKGIKEVTVYRGMSVPETSSMPRSDREVTMQPASSWTTSLETAKSFMREQHGTDSVLLRARIPSTRILSTCVTGRGCLTEAEIIVLGGKMKVQVARRSARSGKFLDWAAGK